MVSTREINRIFGFSCFYTDLFSDTANGQDVVFTSGENVKAIGASPKAGYLAVESRHKTGWVPYKLTRLMVN